MICLCWNSGGADLNGTGILTFGLVAHCRMANYKANLANVTRRSSASRIFFMLHNHTILNA